MMNQEYFWKLKIKAFLHNLPWRVLCDSAEHSQKVAQELINVLLDGKINSDKCNEQIKEADEIAYGLDVPSFVRDKNDL